MRRDPWTRTAAVSLLLALGGCAGKAPSAEAPRPFPTAAAEGRVDDVRRWLSRGGDVDARDSDGGTALMRAALGGHARMVAMLLVAGADPALQSRAGYTAAALAAEAGYDHIVALLNDPSSEVRDAAAAASALTLHVPGLVAPRPTRQVQPKYPDESLRRKVEGEVRVEVVVSKSGIPRPVRVLKSLGLELDRRAIAAVRQWRFEPGRLDGDPVDVLAEIVVSYNIV